MVVEGWGWVCVVKRPNRERGGGGGGGRGGSWGKGGRRRRLVRQTISRRNGTLLERKFGEVTNIHFARNE